MIAVPKTALRICDGVVGYISSFQGKTYVNIRKTYTKDGVEAIGKGLTCTPEQWEAIKGQADEVLDTKYYTED